MSGILHSLPHTPPYCLIIKKKKKAASHTQKGGKGKKVYSSQARKSALRPTLNWPAGEILTSFTVGCHLNAAMGPAIIPLMVLDSGMVRSYREKGKLSRHCGTLIDVFLPQTGKQLFIGLLPSVTFHPH